MALETREVAGDEINPELVDMTRRFWIAGVHHPDIGLGAREKPSTLPMPSICAVSPARSMRSASHRRKAMSSGEKARRWTPVLGADLAQFVKIARDALGVDRPHGTPRFSFSSLPPGGGPRPKWNARRLVAC
jgi:hypothetical protein